MKYDRKRLIDLIDDFFAKVGAKPEEFPVDELMVLIEGIIPVHASLEITDYDQVDILLGVYPYMFQKTVRLFSYFISKARIGSQTGDKKYAETMRTYRDSIEQMLRAIRMQYDALSRRITVNIERRG